MSLQGKIILQRYLVSNSLPFLIFQQLYNLLYFYITENTMFVFGGDLQNGLLSNELLIFDMESHHWHQMYTKNFQEPFVQAACCTVV